MDADDCIKELTAQELRHLIKLLSDFQGDCFDQLDMIDHGEITNVMKMVDNRLREVETGKGRG